MKEDCEEHLVRAEELLKVAENLLVSGFVADSIGRSYYAMHHAARAVLLDMGMDRKSHRAVWAAFGEHVTLKGLVTKGLHRYALDTFSARIRSDYSAHPVETTEDATKFLEYAREFVPACRELLESD